MNKTAYLSLVIGLTVLVSQVLSPQALLANSPTQKISSNNRPELAYLKAVNGTAPVTNPQLLFLLMAQYSNANLQREGAEYLSSLFDRYQPSLNNSQKAMYLCCIATLRAQAASSIGLLERIAHVNKTIEMLQESRDLSANKSFPINYISGVVLAQLPGFFHQSDKAEELLNWCLLHASEAPHPGWLRELYYNLARLSTKKGQESSASHYLELSGYKTLDRPVSFITAFSEDSMQGHKFGSRRIREAVPGKVYVLSGFEFTEYYFVVSEDGKQLIAIDAGTRPDSAKAAYEALLAYAPGLPPLTSVFITHSHWDHIGGHEAFRAINPAVTFYARDNGAVELAKELNTPATFERYFFGERFKSEDVESFKADQLVKSKTELTVGGTRLHLIPVSGGETEDAMLINLPDLGVLFVGDFIMPYIGAPFVQEGNIQGLLDAIDVVTELKPRILLHGHEPLTANFSSTELLTQLKGQITWLREQVLTAIKKGDALADIHNANLIPPELLAGRQSTQLQFLIMREHLIDRIYNQNTGYWHADLTDVNHISRRQKAETLLAYLRISPHQVQRALNQLVNDGKYEQAADLIDLVEDQKNSGKSSFTTIKKTIYLKLMQKYQDTDPFKFIIYASKIKQQIPEIRINTDNSAAHDVN